MNFETMSAEELIKVLVDVAKQLEKRVLTNIQDTRTQVEKLAKTIGLKKISASRVKVKRASREPKQETEQAPQQEVAKETRKEPKTYQHPDNDALVWVKGSGRKPKWLNDLIKKEGWNLEDLEIQPQEEKPRAEEPQEEVKPEEEQSKEPAPFILPH
jgi:hypothetical protein